MKLYNRIIVIIIISIIFFAVCYILNMFLKGVTFLDLKTTIQETPNEK